MLPITLADGTGLYTVEEIAETLRKRTEWRLWAESRQRRPKDRKIPIYPDLCEAIRAYQSAESLLARTK